MTKNVTALASLLSLHKVAFGPRKPKVKENKIYSTPKLSKENPRLK